MDGKWLLLHRTWRAIGELWVQDGLLLLLALGLSSFAGYRLYLKNNSEKNFKMLFLQMKEL